MSRLGGPSAGHAQSSSSSDGVSAPKCDICVKKDGHLGKRLLHCKSCGLYVHSECHGDPARKKVSRSSWTCRACAFLEEGRCRRRPTRCVLCSVSTGIHSMHPLYDTHGPTGVHAKTDDGEFAWVHSLCAFVIGSSNLMAGCVFACDEKGNFDHDGEVELELERGGGSESGSSDSDGGSPPSGPASPSDGAGGATHHFVICDKEDGEESVWSTVIAEARSSLTCGVCNKSDRYPSTSNLRRIPFQCGAGRAAEFPAFKKRHNAKKDFDCYEAVHVGCAMWGAAKNKYRRVFFCPEPVIAEVYCCHHAKNIGVNKSSTGGSRASPMTPTRERERRRSRESLNRNGPLAMAAETVRKLDLAGLLPPVLERRSSKESKRKRKLEEPTPKRRGSTEEPKRRGSAEEPILKKRSSETLEEPTSKRRSSATLEEPIVKRRSSATLEVPIVKKRSSATLEEPIVKKRSSATLEEPIVKKRSSATLENNTAKRRHSSTLSEKHKQRHVNKLTDDVLHRLQNRSEGMTQMEVTKERRIHWRTKLRLEYDEFREIWDNVKEGVLAWMSRKTESGGNGNHRRRNSDSSVSAESEVSGGVPGRGIHGGDIPVPKKKRSSAKTDGTLPLVSLPSRRHSSPSISDLAAIRNTVEETKPSVQPFSLIRRRKIDPFEPPSPPPLPLRRHSSPPLKNFTKKSSARDTDAKSVASPKRKRSRSTLGDEPPPTSGGSGGEVGGEDVGGGGGGAIHPVQKKSNGRHALPADRRNDWAGDGHITQPPAPPECVTPMLVVSAPDVLSPDVAYSAHAVFSADGLLSMTKKEKVPTKKKEKVVAKVEKVVTKKEKVVTEKEKLPDAGVVNPHLHLFVPYFCGKVYDTAPSCWEISEGDLRNVQDI